MGSERCSGSTCSGSASSTRSSLSSTSLSNSVMGADHMVKIEIEAAEALAELAQLAMKENVSESGAKWKTKGKRARKQVKSESPASDSGSNPVDPLPTRSDLVEDRAEVNWEQCERLFGIVSTNPVKAEQDQDPVHKLMSERDIQLHKSSHACAANCSSTGFGRSRRNLTEAEKEARRIRRILANRESARQTIRRRQALCEELTRKAADLAWENEKLKKEKELALKEYQSLETRNKILKEQMDKAIKCEVEEIPEERNTANIQMSPSSPTNYPLFVCNHPPPPYWPSAIRSQHGLQDGITPSNIPILASSSPDSSCEQENHKNMNGPRTPFYVLPFSWFFQPQPSFGLKSKQEETPLNHQYSTITSKTAAHVDDRCFPCTRHESDITQSTSGASLDGGHIHTGGQLMEIQRTHLAFQYGGRAPTIKHDNGHDLCGLSDKMEEPIVSPNKKIVDAAAAAAAAAEARKRRKDLKKIKNLNGRQCQMHY